MNYAFVPTLSQFESVRYDESDLILDQELRFGNIQYRESHIMNESLSVDANTIPKKTI